MGIGKSLDQFDLITIIIQFLNLKCIFYEIKSLLIYFISVLQFTQYTLHAMGNLQQFRYFLLVKCSLVSLEYMTWKLFNSYSIFKGVSPGGY
jgi:hypothetical protein